jgi:hypothetical protein
MKWFRSEFTLCSCRKNSFGEDFCGRGEGIGWWKPFMETIYGDKLWKQCMNALLNQPVAYT